MLSHYRFSFSNYGGLPVKAEYCHEAVRRETLSCHDTAFIYDPGLAFGSSHDINLGIPVRPIHPAPAVAVNRFLYPCFRSCALGTYRSQKSSYVHPSVLCYGIVKLTIL
jgi:hypothetical protein